MRREPFTTGSYVHIVKRGVRGLEIVRDDADRHRVLLNLCHFNDQNQREYWFRELIAEHIADTFKRPSLWKPQEKIVEVIAYCILDNHFHLILKEIVEGGISMFMKRVGTGMAMHFNERYEQKGSLFQGAYRSRTIDSDSYLRYVALYVMAKNAFDMYPGGPLKVAKEFEKAYEWAVNYPYSSLGEYAGKWETGILDKGLVGEIYKTPATLKKAVHDFMAGKYADTFSLGDYLGTPFE